MTIRVRLLSSFTSCLREFSFSSRSAWSLLLSDSSSSSCSALRSSTSCLFWASSLSRSAARSSSRVICESFRMASLSSLRETHTVILENSLKCSWFGKALFYWVEIIRCFMSACVVIIKTIIKSLHTHLDSACAVVLKLGVGSPGGVRKIVLFWLIYCFGAPALLCTVEQWNSGAVVYTVASQHLLQVLLLPPTLQRHADWG